MTTQALIAMRIATSHLARRQRPMRRRIAGGLLGAPGLLLEARRHVDAATGHEADRAKQLVGPDVLGQVGIGARTQRQARVLRLDVHRQHDHRQPRLLDADRSERLEPVARAHVAVHQHHAVAVATDHRQRRAAVCVLAGDADVRLVGEQPREAGAKDGVVVDEEQPNHRWPPGAGAGARRCRPRAPRQRSAWRRSRARARPC